MTFKKIEDDHVGEYIKMGQYYYPIILDADGKIVVWMDPTAYGEGQKLMEHAYLRNPFVNTFEFALSPEGPHYKSRVVWAGDYADPEPGKETNLHHQCNEYNLIHPQEKDASSYRYLVNHTKQQYVDKEAIHTLHPLPLLTAEGNGRGGGDIHDAPPLVGSWARDVISIEKTIPEDFEEVVISL